MILLTVIPLTKKASSSTTKSLSFVSGSPQRNRTTDSQLVLAKDRSEKKAIILSRSAMKRFELAMLNSTNNKKGFKSLDLRPF